MADIFVMPQPVAFTKAYVWSIWSSWLTDPGPPSVLDYTPPPKKGPLFVIFFNQAFL